ncbi:autotransporter domain-containing protein [Pseudomonas baltica]|uniref:autotransporter outer membrane beta-barrel domain-containing protein n=1 Tax=Pseudomonas baltica TaxID=2762576 RepID=UPI0028A2C816|nr:autotransporter domain-containing protein [Pseudomonas baltica]
MTYPQHRLALAIALATLAGPVHAVSGTVSTATTAQQELSGSDHLTVTSTGSIIYSAGKAVSLKGATSGTGVVVDNSGLIKSTTGRAIASSGSEGSSRNYVINNLSGATIDGYDDALRIDSNFAGGSFTLNNRGTIHSSTGQGLDLDAVRDGGVAITVNNYAGALIRGDASDGMKTGSNATIFNWGEISTGDSHTDEQKYDGIDIDSASNVTVQNYGIISGGRHGITTDNGATLANFRGGEITGRNGSGYGSDGNGTVYNWGTITGAYAGLKANGDGDGVDIDLIGHIENYGTIQGTGAGGVDKNGFANGSEGIALGGGYVFNASGALVSGANNGILVDDGSNGAGVGATTIINQGTIQGLNGFGINLVGEYKDTVTNSGLISGSNGLALGLGGGDDTLVVLTGGRFAGLVDGGTGRDQVILDAAGGSGGTFGTSQNFEWLQVNQGAWTLTGSGDFSEGGAIANGATLINQGGVAGTLTVDNGGVYAGGGSVGNLIVNGTLLTNSTLGTATINHDLTLNSGATLAYGVNADGTSAPLSVGGTAYLNGATLAVQPSAGDYPWLSHYTVLQAGAVTGTFGKVTSDYAFLTPTLSYTATQVDLAYARNDVAFANYATNSSDRNAASSISQLGQGNALYNAVLNTSTATASSAITQLSGATTASLGAATLAGSAQVGSSMLAAMQSMSSNGALMVGLDDKDTPILVDTGVPASARNLNDPNAQGRLWLQGLSSYGKLDGSNGSSAVEQRTHGAVLGADWAILSDWRLGVLGGYSKTGLDASGLSGDIDSWHLGVYAQHYSGPLALRLGAAYSGHDGSSKRHVSFSGFNDTPRGDYHANSQQAFAELGYALGSGRLNLEPFANLGYQRYHRNSYQEKGGAAAMDVNAQTQDNVTTTLGLRFAHLTQLDNGISLTPRGSLGWRHTYGDVDSSTTQAFLAGGSAFSVQGTALDRDSLMVEAGLDVGFSARQSLGLGYSGELGSNSRNHAVIGQWQLRF